MFSFRVKKKEEEDDKDKDYDPETPMLSVIVVETGKGRACYQSHPLLTEVLCFSRVMFS